MEDGGVQVGARPMSRKGGETWGTRHGVPFFVFDLLSSERILLGRDVACQPTQENVSRQRDYNLHSLVADVEFRLQIDHVLYLLFSRFRLWHIAFLLSRVLFGFRLQGRVHIHLTARNRNLSFPRLEAGLLYRYLVLSC
jgi:hypothetical protein